MKNESEIEGLYRMDRNYRPIILWCAECALKGNKSIAFFVYGSDSLCTNCFFEKADKYNAKK